MMTQFCKETNQMDEWVRKRYRMTLRTEQLEELDFIFLNPSPIIHQNVRRAVGTTTLLLLLAKYYASFGYQIGYMSRNFDGIQVAVKLAGDIEMRAVKSGNIVSKNSIDNRIQVIYPGIAEKAMRGRTYWAIFRDDVPLDTDWTRLFATHTKRQLIYEV